MEKHFNVMHFKLLKRLKGDVYTDIKALSDKDYVDLNLLTLRICRALEIDANGAVNSSRSHEEAQ